MTTNRMGLEQTLSDERLEMFIRQPLDNGLTRGEQMELVREALARRKESKEPVAWTDAEELRDANSGGCGYLFPIGGSANKFADPRRQIMLYEAPPIQAVTVPMKDHQIRELVNDLRDIAVKYHGTQQLRERIARAVRSVI